MTYCDRIIRSAPDITPDKALRQLQSWQERVQTSDKSNTVAAKNAQLTETQTNALLALYAQHVRQIDQIILRLHDKEVELNNRSVLTIEDMQAEGYQIFRLAAATYTGEHALSTHVHTVCYTRMSNVLRDARKRESVLDDAIDKGQEEPPATTYTPPLPVDLDLAEIAEDIIEDRPPKERKRLREVWHRLRNPS